MPLYFFHIHDGRDLPDEVGITLAGAEDARAAAIIAAGETLQDLGAMFWKHPDWWMHVIDEQDATVCGLRLSTQLGPERVLPIGLV